MDDPLLKCLLLYSKMFPRDHVELSNNYGQMVWDCLFNRLQGTVISSYVVELAITNQCFVYTACYLKVFVERKRYFCD